MEQGAGSEVQGAWSREQGAGSRDGIFFAPCPMPPAFQIGSLPEIYLLHFSITCCISFGRSDSNESLLPVTG
jgi:hypothetical protein